MSGIFVIGVGMTAFGKFAERSPEDLGREAVLAALVDAGVDMSQVQAAFCGHVFQGMSMGQRVLASLGARGIPITNVENACCSGSTALHSAVQLLRSGEADCVLAIGVESLTGRFAGALSGDDSDIESLLGMTMPAVYAMRAQRYMAEYGASREQLAGVVVKNKANAACNPLAQFKKEVSVDQVLQSRVIATPLNMLDCCPVSDGAAAVLLCTGAARARLGATRAVKLAASILVSGEYDTSPGDMTFEPLTRHAAKAAWAEAGLGPQDIDFAEVHDCFSIAEATRVEGLGLFDPGTYLDAVQRGEASPTGRLPVNSSGGLLGKGHPLGATGIAQVVELANQIRGDAGARQLGKARVGVAHCRGGKAVGVEGTACTVHVLIK